MGLIKKQYGKAVLVDEINKMLQDAIYNYIQEEKLNILGNPLPVEQEEMDFDTPGTYNFGFELGLSPEVNITITKKNKIKGVKVIADKKVLDTYMEDIRGRYGKMLTPENPEADDMYHGSITEIDADGNAIDGGIVKEDAQFMGTNLKTKKAQGELTKSTLGTTLVLDSKKTLVKAIM